jgi:hypothetical protein
MFLAWLEQHEHAIAALSTIVIALFTAALFLATFLLWWAGERHSERQLRAYLVVDNVSISRFAAGQTIETYAILKNTGQTPACDIDGYIAIMYDAFPLPYDFPVANREGSTEQRSVLGSGGIVHAKVPTIHAPTLSTIQGNAGALAATQLWRSHQLLV